MKAPGLKLHELLRRLGERQLGDSPAHGDMIVPVGIAYDARDLVGSPLAPRFLSGTARTPTAGAYAFWQVTCKSEGGLWISQLNISGGAAGNFIRFLLLASPVVPSLAGAPVTYNLCGVPPVSIVSGGETAAAVGSVESPGAGVPFLGNFSVRSRLFVPPGFTFVIASATVTSGIAVFVAFEELPVASGDLP